MTRFEQVDALELFRDGEFKVIMATTIAEEGLDIKECNLIVRYDYAGSSISMMQARGKVTKKVVYRQYFSHLTAATITTCMYTCEILKFSLQKSSETGLHAKRMILNNN